MRPALFALPMSLVYDPSVDASTFIWYKADALSLNDGDLVSPWTASKGSDATGSNKPAFKTNIKNGLPVVRFSAGNILTVSTPANSGPPFQLFVVLNATGTLSGTIGIVGTHSSDAGAVLGIQSGGGGGWTWSNNLTPQSFGTPDTNWHIILVTTDTNGTHNSKHQIDNGTLTTFPSDAGSDSIAGIRLECSVGSGTTVDIGEVIVRVGRPDPAPVFSYLNTRWAVY